MLLLLLYFSSQIESYPAYTLMSTCLASVGGLLFYLLIIIIYLINDIWFDRRQQQRQQICVCVSFLWLQLIITFIDHVVHKMAETWKMSPMWRLQMSRFVQQSEPKEIQLTEREITQIINW